MSEYILVQPSPSPSRTVIDAPAADAFQTVGAVLAIVLALAAAVLGYRILRGGKGL
jgi:hypothetical protein